jgi:uncharacterized cupin superfamily protein
MLCHWDEVPERVAGVGPMRAAWADLGSAAGTLGVGLRRVRIDPDGQSTPAHAHDGEEELCFVLAGDGVSWQDGATYAVQAGDVLLHPPRGPAHTLIGGAGGLDVLMFGERLRAEISRLPRAGVAWIGSTWAEAGQGPGPWEREAQAGPVEAGEPAPRPPSIAAVEDLAAEEVRRGETAMALRRLGAAVGSVHTGMRLMAIEPGALGYPPHCHSSEEELFVVLDGAGTLLLGDDERPVRAGHVVSRPAGTGVAHAFRAGAGTLTLLAYGTRDPGDMAWYPRSAKVAVRGLGVRFRVAQVEYWDGEE